MSVGKRITSAVIASWVGRAVTVLLNLAFIPVLFRYMGKEELGLWFLLGQSGSFLALMDMGAAPVLIRHIAFSVASGSGREELADLIAVARIFYHVLAVAVFIIAWLCGVLFIGLLSFEQIDRETAVFAWTLLCFGHGLTVWAGVWPCILQGAGHIGSSLVLGMLVNSLTITVQVIVVILGGGLVELAAIAVAGGVLARYSMYRLLHYLEPEIVVSKGKWKTPLFRSLVKPSLKAWVTTLGGFLVLKTDHYFIASIRNVNEIPAYNAAYQVVSNIYVLAVSLAGASGVYISYLWQNQALVNMRKIIIRNMQCSLSIMMCGTICLYFTGKEFFEFWLGSGNFIGTSVLLVFSITLLLQTQHEMIVTFARSTGHEAFVLSSVLAGLFNLLLTFYLIRSSGLIGVALATLLAQLATNNWYGVYQGLNRLGISLKRYAREVIFPVLFIGILTLTFSYGVVNTIETSNLSLVRILLVFLVCAVTLSGSLCYFIFSERLRYSENYHSRGLIE